MFDFQKTNIGNPMVYLRWFDREFNIKKGGYLIALFEWKSRCFFQHLPYTAFLVVSTASILINLYLKYPLLLFLIFLVAHLTIHFQKFYKDLF